MPGLLCVKVLQSSKGSASKTDTSFVVSSFTDFMTFDIFVTTDRNNVIPRGHHVMKDDLIK